MPIDDFSGGTLSIFNATTNKKLCDLDDVKDISVDKTVIEEYSYNSEMHKVLNFPTRSEYTMNFTTNETVNLDKLLGLDTAQIPDAYDIQYVKVIQARKHKKNRINKKWLKRYGYKQVIVNSKGWKVNTHADGTVEFMK